MIAVFRSARDSRARDARTGVLVGHEHQSRGVLFAVVLLLLSGCQSFEVQQTCQFVNEEGQFVEVDYCSGKKDYENTFYTPSTGKTHEFTSKLRVKVRLENESFNAYQRMNLFQNGTMYESGNREWLFVADGFTCSVWRQFDDPNNHTDQPSYKQVFAGVLSQAPKAGE